VSSWVDASVALLAGHPHWAGLFVFLVAALEAVVLAGYVIPGAMILVAVGGIVGVGHLPLLPILAWATAGAIAGDGFSYWLGYRYRETLAGRWPFSRYPDLMAQGEAFFRRHGGKSVVLGRFLPVLRPIIPTVAGILGMPPRRFYPANALSALVWAPLHILPGVLAGASLELLRGVSPRLAVAALGVLAVLVLGWWSTRLLVLRTTPLARRLFDRAYAWTQRNRGSLLQRLAVRFDPAHPATAALVATLTLLVVALAGFFALVEDVVTRDELVRSDQAISTLMQGVRNPWTDPFMIAVSSLGDSIVTGAVALTLLGWLVLRGHRRLALAAGSALALTAAGLPLLKLLVRAPRPVAMYAGFDAFSFPSGHTSMAAAVYGLVAWLGAGALGQRWRPLVYLPALFWMLLMATSRVYLGAHWSSDVLAGLCFGLLAPLALAALYHAYPRTGVHPGRMVLLLTLVLATFGASHLSRTWGQSVARYLPEETVKPLDVAAWRRGRGPSLPSRRTDLGGEPEEPLVLQWLGTPQALASRLAPAGWSVATPWRVAGLAGFLRPDTGIEDLPILPKLHEGRFALLTLTRASATEPDSRWVLRAWPSGYRDAADGAPLLLASLTRERVLHPARMLTLVWPEPSSEAGIRRLRGSVRSFAVSQEGDGEGRAGETFPVMRAGQMEPQMPP